MEPNKPKYAPNSGLDRAYAIHQWKQRIRIIGWSIVLFGLFGAAVYFVAPKERLLHESFLPAIIQNSFTADYEQRSSTSFRVTTENGGDYTIRVRYPHSLGIDGKHSCVELRKGADSGKIYTRLVHLKKCDG